MEEKYKLLLSVLRELSKAEVLNDLILAGSWCQFYYRILFDEAPEIPLIRTTDIDFLIPNPFWICGKNSSTLNYPIFHSPKYKPIKVSILCR